MNQSIRGWRLDACLVALALVLFVAVSARTGRIPVNDGRGWDGVDYTAMLVSGWSAGTPNTALRPLVVLLDRPLLRVIRNPLLTFVVANAVYLGLLALGLCLLCQVYNPDPAARVALIANVFLTIAVVKHVAYYPALIDTGALALTTLALYAAVRDRRLMAAVLCCAAALAREFGVAVVAFGLCRDLRRRVPLRSIAMTYAPAVVLSLSWRQYVLAHWTRTSIDEMLGADQFLDSLELWKDPAFVAFFLYFLATTFGGVSLVVWGRAGSVVSRLRHEPEWGVFTAAIVAAAAVGNADIWRYLAYLLPAAAVAFGAATADLGRRPLVVVSGLALVATVVTQAPFARVDLASYFRDWFPYYIQQGDAPVPLMALWPVWSWRLMGAVGFLWLFATIPLRTVELGLRRGNAPQNPANPN